MEPMMPFSSLQQNYYIPGKYDKGAFQLLPVKRPF